MPPGVHIGRCKTVSVLAGLWLVLGATTACARTPAPGRAIYQRAGCAVCHQPDARGVPGVYPMLAGRVGRIAQRAAGRRYLIDVVAFGMVGAIKVDGQKIAGFMPPHPQLSDEDIASALTWLSQLDAAPGQPRVHFIAAGVHKVRAEPVGPGAVHALRGKVLGGSRTTPRVSAGARGTRPGVRAPRSAEARPVPAALARWRPGARAAAAPRVNWMLHCAGCHGLNGAARVPTVPELRNFAGYFTHSTRGRAYLVRAPGPAMSLLSDADLTAVMNWMLESLSRAQLPAHFRPYTVREVHRLRQHPLTLHAAAVRAAVLAQLRKAGVIPAQVATNGGFIDGTTRLSQ